MSGVRIAYTTSARIPSRAANAVQSLKMCDAFAGIGHRVTMYCRRGEDLDIQTEFGLCNQFEFRPIAPLPLRGLRTVAFETTMLRRARRRPRPDLYFSRDVYSLCGLASTRVPMILELHRTMEGHRVEQEALDWLRQRSNLRAVVVVSRGMADWYAQRFPGLALTVEPGAADPGAGENGGVRGQRLGRADTLQLGYFGHLYEGRGVEVLAEIAARLRNVDVNIFGGTEADLKRCRETFKLDNLKFFGHVPHAAVASYTEALDVLMAPYQERVVVAGGAETSAVMSPLKIFEYMASNRPMICSDLPVLREILDEEVAVLVPPADVDGWVRAVGLLADPGRRQTLASAARQRFMARHTWSARAKRLVALGLS